MKKILVIGKTCMPCHQLQEWLAEKKIELETLVGEENMQFCRTYGICTTPTLVIINEAEAPSTYDTYKTIPGKDAIIEYLEGMSNAYTEPCA